MFEAAETFEVADGGGRGCLGESKLVKWPDITLLPAGTSLTEQDGG